MIGKAPHSLADDRAAVMAVSRIGIRDRESIQSLWTSHALGSGVGSMLPLGHSLFCKVVLGLLGTKPPFRAGPGLLFVVCCLLSLVCCLLFVVCL